MDVISYPDSAPPGCAPRLSANESAARVSAQPMGGRAGDMKWSRARALSSSECPTASEHTVQSSPCPHVPLVTTHHHGFIPTQEAPALEQPVIPSTLVTGVTSRGGHCQDGASRAIAHLPSGPDPVLRLPEISPSSSASCVCKSGPDLETGESQPSETRLPSLQPQN